MSEIIVAERSEILKSKKGKTYFTVKDTEGNTYVCYHPNQHPDFKPHSNPEVKISPNSNPDYSPSIELAKEGEKPTQPQRRKSDDTNRSIEKQVALKGAIEITKALIESKTWGKDDLTIPNINATIKKIANSNDEWLMSSQKVVEKIVEEIEKP